MEIRKEYIIPEVEIIGGMPVNGILNGSLEDYDPDQFDWGS